MAECLLVISTKVHRTPLVINDVVRKYRDPEELSSRQRSRLARHTMRIDALLEQPALTDQEKRVLNARLRQACRIVVMAPRAELDALSGAQQLAILRTFSTVAANRPPSSRIPKAVRERYAREDAERAARGQS